MISPPDKINQSSYKKAEAITLLVRKDARFRTHRIHNSKLSEAM